MDHERFIGVSSRQTKCRCCGGAMEPGSWHFCFRYLDGSWRKSLRICSFCLFKILKEVKP